MLLLLICFKCHFINVGEAIVERETGIEIAEDLERDDEADLVREGDVVNQDQESEDVLNVAVREKEYLQIDHEAAHQRKEHRPGNLLHHQCTSKCVGLAAN